MQEKGFKLLVQISKIRTSLTIQKNSIMKLKKWLYGLFIFIGILYIGLCAVLYFVQERVIFNPTPLPQDFVFNRGEEIRISVEEDIDLHCLKIKAPRSKGVILYLHGNKGSNRRAFFQAQNLTDNRYDVFMVDYRGYGKSNGYIHSERQLYQDIQKVYDYLLTQYEEQQIVVVGYSLGSGMASFLGAKNSPQHLVLVAPYRSMTAMKNLFIPFTPNFLLKYELNNYDHLENVRCPVTIFHGTADELIPYRFAEELQEIDPNNIRLVEMRGIGHRGVIFNGQFSGGMAKLLKK